MAPCTGLEPASLPANGFQDRSLTARTHGIYGTNAPSRSDRSRTDAPLIKSQLLCHLSYGSMNGVDNGNRTRIISLEG